jgi:hypothetical protein
MKAKHPFAINCYYYRKIDHTTDAMIGIVPKLYLCLKKDSGGCMHALWQLAKLG